MHFIDKHSFFFNKYNPINQLISVFRKQLFKSVAVDEGGADFSNNTEVKEEISRQLLNSKIVGITQKGAAIIEISPEDDCPKLKNEIYRLVEKSFEVIGGNTGRGIKTDDYNEKSFKQLIVVKREQSEDVILSGYRYSLIGEAISLDNGLNTPMGNFFDFDEEILNKLVKGNAIELGTAWVNKEVGKKAIYGLHGIRDGLVHLLDRYQNEYFLGKMTIPSEDAPESYSKISRDFSIAYLDRFHSAGNFHNKVTPKTEFIYNVQDMDMVLLDVNGDFSLDEKKLKEVLISIDPKNEKGLFPNMFPIYLRRIKKINYIGTVKNGKVCESGIIVPCNEIKKEEIASRQPNIDNRKKRFGNQDIRYGDYLDMSKSL